MTYHYAPHTPACSLFLSHTHTAPPQHTPSGHRMGLQFPFTILSLTKMGTRLTFYILLWYLFVSSFTYQDYSDLVHLVHLVHLTQRPSPHAW